MGLIGRGEGGEQFARFGFEIQGLDFLESGKENCRGRRRKEAEEKKVLGKKKKKWVYIVNPKKKNLQTELI